MKVTVRARGEPQHVRRSRLPETRRLEAGVQHVSAHSLARAYDIDRATIDYFNGLAEQLGIPYQTLINLCLRECAATGKKLQLTWASEDGRAGE